MGRPYIRSTIPSMIGYLHGTLLRADPERLLLDVQGVGYEVNVPLSTWYEIEKRREAPIGLFIHTHMREDGIALFGFWTEREKALFEKLIGVNGIGPRLARVILSGMAPDDLLGAIARGDLGRLGTIPGVGKKTAERIVLELREKMRMLAADLPETAPPRPPTTTWSPPWSTSATRPPSPSAPSPTSAARSPTPPSTTCCGRASTGCRRRT